MTVSLSVTPPFGVTERRNLEKEPATQEEE